MRGSISLVPSPTSVHPSVTGCSVQSRASRQVQRSMITRWEERSISSRTISRTAGASTYALATGGSSGGAPAAERERIRLAGVWAGRAFQIVDDILDIDGNESQLGKSKGVDFIDGKPTLPLMFAMRDPQLGERLAELFVKKEKTKQEVEEALRMVKKTDAIVRSFKEAEGFKSKALKNLEGIPDSIFKVSLTQLAEMVVARRK